MNCRALFSQERSSAKVPACLARHAEARDTGALQVVCPARRPGDQRNDVERAVTGNAATGVPQAQCFKLHDAKGVGETWKTEDSAPPDARVRSLPFFSENNWTVRFFCCSIAFCGPSPTTTLEPGRSSERNASIFFSIATTAHGHEDRSPADRSRPARRAGTDRCRPARQKAELSKPRPASSCRNESVATISSRRPRESGRITHSQDRPGCRYGPETYSGKRVV